MLTELRTVGSVADLLWSIRTAARRVAPRAD